MSRRPQAGQRALFQPSEASIAPSATARLRALALTAPARTRRAETRAEEDSDTLEKLRHYAVELSAHFNLHYSTIEAEADGVVEHYGICYADGRIRIRLRHATTGRLLKESSLVDTLCHELAHLRHFDHSIRFRRFHRRILDEARRRGWYAPGPAVQVAPQAPLFDLGACGLTGRRESLR
jgi:predicted metal-dependent hydrolase